MLRGITVKSQSTSLCRPVISLKGQSMCPGDGTNIARLLADRPMGYLFLVRIRFHCNTSPLDAKASSYFFPRRPTTFFSPHNASAETRTRPQARDLML